MSKLIKLIKITISVVIIASMLLFALTGCYTYQLPGSVSGTEPGSTTTKQDSEILISESQISTNDSSTLGDSDITVQIDSGSINKDDILRVSKCKNQATPSDELIFSQTAYNISIAADSYFKKPIKITLKYDESMIPEGLSENTIFAGFQLENGDIYIQGGEVNKENNTITVETFHTSKIFTGATRKPFRYLNGDSIEIGKINRYNKDRLELFDEAFNLIINEKNFQKIGSAEKESYRLFLEFKKWFDAAGYSIEYLDDLNPLSTAAEFSSFAAKLGLEFTTEKILELLPAYLSKLGYTGGAAALKCAGTLVGYISAVTGGIIIGRNIGWSLVVIEKVTRMDIAHKQFRIADLATGYLKDKDNFETDLSWAKYNGLIIKQSKIDMVRDIIDSANLAAPEIETTTDGSVPPTETAVETTAAETTTSDDGNDTNFYFVNHPVFIEGFEDFAGWNSQYGGATIDNGVLKISGQDIENDGRSRDVISINKNLNTAVPRYWKIKARLSSEGLRAGTGFTITLYYDTVIEKTIALNFDRSSIRGVDSIFLIESGVDTSKENVIIETGFVPELDKWYEVEVYYAPIWSGVNSFNLKVNGTDIGWGQAPTEWMGSGNIKSDKITIWNENSVEVDYIEIYDVSREYKN